MNKEEAEEKKSHFVYLAFEEHIIILYVHSHIVILNISVACHFKSVVLVNIKASLLFIADCSRFFHPLLSSLILLPLFYAND